MKAIIPAGGHGTRMRPLTRAIPKEMLPVGTKPAIQHVVDEATAAGIEEILVVIAPGKDAIVEHLGSGEHQDAVEFTTQPEPLGLGDAILQGERFVDDEPFAVLYPDNIILSDVPAIQQLIDAHDRIGAPVSHAVRVEKDAIHRYSAIDGTEEALGLYRVHDVVEKPDPSDAPSNVAPIGRYILEASIFEALRDTEPGHGGELQLTDAIARQAYLGEHYAMLLDGTRLDAGTPERYLEANIAMHLAEPANRTDPPGGPNGPDDDRTMARADELTRWIEDRIEELRSETGQP